MKKLNQTELSVIACQIRDNLQEEAKKAQDALNEISDKNNLRQAQAIVRRLHNLPEDCKDFLAKQSHGSRNLFKELKVEDVLCFLRTGQTQVKRPSYQNIYNSLVLAQIESPDLNSLIRNVTKQFISFTP